MWTAVMFLLVSLELRTLYLDRDEHDREQALERCEERRSFENIAGGLQASINASAKQYTSTINRVNGVLQTTQTVASLSRENLDAVSGGNSYFYFIVMSSDNGQLIAKGTHAIRSSHVTIIDDYDLKSSLHKSVKIPLNNDDMLRRLYPAYINIDTGDIPAGGGHLITQIFPSVIHGSDIRLSINLYALNGTWTEELIGKRGKMGGWQEAIRLTGVTGPQKGRVIFEQVDPDMPRNSNGRVDWDLVDFLNQPVAPQ